MTETSFLGLAPFLRMSLEGKDLRPIGQDMLSRIEHDTGNANLWMNLSIVMQCIGQRDFGLVMQAQALALKRVYHLAASEQHANLRLLMLSVPGDIAANTPLDCLLEKSDIDLIVYYVSPGDPLTSPIPDHDVLFVAICESDENRGTLAYLGKALEGWPKPVINSPQYIPSTGRAFASRLLQDVPGLLIPPTLRASNSVLQSIAAGKAELNLQFNGCDFPIILRPIDSHAGRNLEKISDSSEIAAYLSQVQGDEFFLSRFIDYSGKDGLFRKFRIALIGGEPYACHMAVSSNWMIHYVNAGMYEDAQKRNEEADFMEHFDLFSKHHRSALDAIYKRINLDYVCIDCAETQDGQLFVFEIDHAMVVHAMDPETLFPYKQRHMHKVQKAFRDLLFRLTSNRLIPARSIP